MYKHNLRSSLEVSHRLVRRKLAHRLLLLLHRVALYWLPLSGCLLVGTIIVMLDSRLAATAALLGRLVMWPCASVPAAGISM